MSKQHLLGTCFAAVALFAPHGVFADDDDDDKMEKLGDALFAVHQQALSRQQMLLDESDVSSQVERDDDDIVLGQASVGDQTLFFAQSAGDNLIYIEAVASGVTADLVSEMEAMGALNIASSGRLVSAEFPATQLDALAASRELAFARPVLAQTNVGLVTSQADVGMGTDLVRTVTGLTGSGITYGILSDSFACSNPTGPAEAAASGDLPPNIVILEDIAGGCIDEGRAMAELMYDIAPDSNFIFHTAFTGQAGFAEGINELALAGADVIVDDVIYFLEPMFQDGIIAQAADEVARLGVPYYSSNGNNGREAGQGEFRAVEATVGGITGYWHDFDDGPGVDVLNTVTLGGSLQTNIVLQWDSPNFSVSGAPGAQNDVDFVMFDQFGVPVADCFPNGFFSFPSNGLCQFNFTSGGVPIDGGNGGDAADYVSLVDFTGGATVQVGLVTDTGAPAGYYMYALFSGGFDEASAEYAILGDGASYGHSNAAGAEGVGASGFFFNEALNDDPQTFDFRGLSGEAPCSPACLNDFSSAGGTPVFFDTEGNRLATPEVRLKPGITGPDGSNNTFFGVDTFRDDDDGDGIFQSFEPGEFPNFFGTSAAAPNVAAVAGLMIEDERSQILTGNGRFRMCAIEAEDIAEAAEEGEEEGESLRDEGETRRVRAANVLARIEAGWLLGPCHRTEPADIYRIKRETAQDMSIRASLSDGSTTQIFDEVGPAGFDFDSGFGFIDAVAAINQAREER